MQGEWTRHKALSSSDLEALACSARAGDVVARNQIIEHNLSFARWMARNAHPAIREDLEQAAAEGLIPAARRLDPKKGKFSTYAWHWSNREMEKEKARMAGFSVSRHGSLCEFDPLHPSNVASLDCLIPGQDRYWIDVIPDSACRDPEIEAIEHIDSLSLRSAVKVLLSPREQEVISRRFGLGGSGARPESLEEIGRSYGLSREWIRQIEATALEKLRHGWHAVPSVAKPLTWESVKSHPDLLAIELRRARPLDVCRRAGVHLITLNKALAGFGILPVEKPSKKALMDLYYTQKRSQQSIAQVLGVRDYDVRRWFAMDGLKARSRSEALSSPKPGLDDLWRWYEIEGLTIAQIKARTKAGYPAVKRWLTEAGCRIRTGKPPSPYDELEYRKRSAQDLVSKIGIEAAELKTHHFFKARQETGKTYEGLMCWYRRRYKVTYARAVEVLKEEVFGIGCRRDPEKVIAPFPDTGHYALRKTSG